MKAQTINHRYRNSDFQKNFSFKKGIDDMIGFLNVYNTRNESIFILVDSDLKDWFVKEMRLESIDKFTSEHLNISKLCGMPVKFVPVRDMIEYTGRCLFRAGRKFGDYPLKGGYDKVYTLVKDGANIKCYEYTYESMIEGLKYVYPEDRGFTPKIVIVDEMGDGKVPSYNNMGGLVCNQHQKNYINNFLGND